jgi:hypothetical protein
VIRPAAKAAALALLGLLLLPHAAPDAAETTLRASRRGNSPLQLHAEARDGSWHIRVLDAGGVERQRIEVPTDAPESPARLVDVDGDGAADLWLPVITGNANTTFELWRMQPARAQFTRAGELFGSVFTLDPRGYLIASGRNGCCAAEHVFHRLDAGSVLVRAFTIARRFGPEAAAAESCTVAPGGETPSAGLVAQICALGADSAMPGKRLPVN